MEEHAVDSVDLRALVAVLSWSPVMSSFGVHINTSTTLTILFYNMDFVCCTLPNIYPKIGLN